MTMFSFHPVKAVTTGEGGVITTRDAGLRDALRDFRSHGMTRDPARLVHADGGWSMEQHALGFNYRLTDIQSALGRSQLGQARRASSPPATRSPIATARRSATSTRSSCRRRPRPARSTPTTCSRSATAAARRPGGRSTTACASAASSPRSTTCPLYRHPWYRETYGYRPGLCPAAEDYYAGCLSLPCFPALSADDQATVIAAVRALPRAPR